MDVVVVGLLDSMTEPSWREGPIDIDGPATTLVAFFEPIGGHGDADAAPLSQLAAQTVDEALRGGDLRTEKLGASVVAALSLANEAVLRECKSPRYTACASRAMVAVFDRASLVVAHVGNGAAFLLREESCCLLSRGQTLRRALREGGSGRWERSPKHAALSFLGKSPRLTAVVSQVAPRRGDRLLLCSEELVRRLGMQAILAASRGGMDSTQLCETLARQCATTWADGGGATVCAAVDFLWEGWPVPALGDPPPLVVETSAALFVPLDDLGSSEP
ncbi:MAG: hypothetical protein IPK82_17680 [Polyangiaceae bacterium]|nr:hypothetical protein [Polyangiaceae bacterium]